MAQRNVAVRFTAEIQGFKTAMAEAAASTQKLKGAAEDSSKAADTHLGKLVQSANKNREAWDTAGTTMLGFGTAAVGGLALAGKAAMDWESAWAGVTKTVNGTPAQMDELEASLRGLAKTLPATHEEIAGVAEAAGQLGVKREDVVGFTKTMIDLGNTTNLTADEAATSIAQISNVMGTMERDGSKGVERFGATLVALGNAGASTEAEILDMAKRIAGAAKLVGASESDVLALSNAMASVGIEAQLGGGVISRVMQRMYGDVKTGGEGLDNLAKVAGVSSKDFAKAFETDPVRAVDMMVQGLNKVKESGGNVIDTMADLGIKGTEETSVILRLAGAGTILSDSLKLGDSAWESNSALAAEAAKRYETTESKVKIAWNNIKDAAIDAGAVLLPMIAGLAEGAAGLAGAFGGLPEPVKGVLTVLGGVVGIAALGAGAFLTLTPKILDSMQAFEKLAPAGGKAATALGKVGKAAGAAGALATVTLIFAKLAESDYMSKIDTGMGRVSNALAEISTRGPGAQTALDQIFKDRDGGDLINTVTDLDSAINRTFNRDGGQQFNDWGEAVVHGMTGIKGSSQILEDSFKRLDTGLADLVSSGKAGDAAKSFEQIKTRAAELKVPVEELVKKFPEYADALKAAEAAAKTAATETDGAKVAIKGAGDAAAYAGPSAEDLAKQLEDVGLRADGTVANLDKFTQALVNAGLLTLSSRDATAKFDEALDSLDGKVREIMATQQAHGGVLNESKTDLDLYSDAGRAANDVLADMTQKGIGAAEAMAKNGASMPEVQNQLTKTYDAMVLTAMSFGLGKTEAENLTGSILHIPPGVDVKTWMSDEAKRMAEGTKKAIEDIPTQKEILISIREETHRIAYEQRVVDSNGNEPTGGGLYGSHATGGRLPAFSGGGKLPANGPGTGITDGFLGISSAGVPLARVDKDEWIINGPSSNRYNRELAAINAGTFPKMPGYANGARAGREYSAQSLGWSPASAAGNVSVSAPAVTVMIGNEQLDSRMYRVAGSAINAADSQSQFSRRGR